MIVLDTSILIDFYRKKNKSKSKLIQLSENYSDFAISTISYYEFGVGLKNKNDITWLKLSQNLLILDFDKKCSDLAIDIFKNLKIRNKIIEFPDIAIASTAIVHNLPLATFNKKHFERIPELQLI
jgi:predicted nucleic acid-binding protein